MNCQDITQLMDEGDMGHLTDKERGEVEIHLSGCPHCAADWKVHQRLAKGFAPPMPAGLMERARALVVAGASVETRRPPRRAILFGTILVVAAAAALLGLWFNKPAAIQAPVESQLTQSAALPQVDALPAVQVESEPVVAAKPKPAVLPPGALTVRVAPLRIEGDDAAGTVQAQRFRQLVIAKLRGVHGLAVVDPAAGNSTAGAEYEIRMTYSVSATGLGGRVVKVDPATSVYFAAIDAAIAAEAKMDPADQQRTRQARQANELQRLAGSGPHSSELRMLLAPGFPLLALLDLGGLPAPPSTDLVDNAATKMVQDLRVKFFPLDVSLESELLATLRDSAQTEPARFSALGYLLTIAERRGGLQSTDAAVVRAGAELALTMQIDSFRKITWSGLASTGNPELVPYLIRGLDIIPQAEARLQLVKILANDFKDDPRAREALKAVPRQDVQQLVSIEGVRGSRDESKWNDYVHATLNDAGLSDQLRLQPIADMAPADLIAIAGPVKSIELSDEEIRKLSELIARAARDNSSDDAPRNAGGRALWVLGLMRGPVALDSLIQIVNMPDNEPAGPSKVSVGHVRSNAMALLAQNFYAEPKARAAIEAVTANYPASPLGSDAKMALQIMGIQADREKRKKQRESQPPEGSPR